MKNLLTLIAVLFYMSAISCKKQPAPKPDTYEIRIEAQATNYTLQIEKYLNAVNQSGAKTFTVNPTGEVTLYYATSSPLWIKIYINGVKKVDQTQPVGSHLFYLKKNF